MMKNWMSVVTSCTNGRDILLEDQAADHADFIAYVDQFSPSSMWEQRAVHEQFKSPRRNSRIHKILIHQYVNSDYSLWIDGNIKLLVPAEQLVEEWMASHDIAIFQHRIRDCLYDEADLCAELNLDCPQLIQEQAQHYRALGYPVRRGLAEACVILRRHTPAVERFNNAWWSEYSRFSVRDQISLMYAAWKTSVSINLITPTKYDHPYFQSVARPPGIEHQVQLPANVLEIC